MLIRKYFHRDTVEFVTFFTIFLCVLWEPIRAFVFPTDGGGRIPNTMVLISLLLNKNRWSEILNVIKSPAFKIWIILILYSIINVLCKGYLGARQEMTTFGLLRACFIRPFLIMLIITMGMQINRDGCLLLLAFCLVLYVAFGFMNSSGWGRDQARMLSDLGNRVPLTSITCVFVITINWLEKKVDNSIFFLVILFCLFVIFISGTRKAFGAFVIVGFCACLNKIGELSFLKFMELVIFGIVIYLGIAYVMGHTVLGSRIAASSETKVVPLVANETVNKFLMVLLGDRAIMYLYGLEMFPNAPITGIGISNYMYVSGHSHVLHTEYMAQLVENGLIGFSLLMLFYYVILRDLRKRKKRQENNVYIYYGGILAILFINITAWTYNGVYAMVIYAIVINFLYVEHPNEQSLK